MFQILENLPYYTRFFPILKTPTPLVFTFVVYINLCKAVLIQMYGFHMGSRHKKTDFMGEKGISYMLFKCFCSKGGYKGY